MKLLVLLNGGRTGTDFFQSLLDGHEQILQFPGTFYFDDLWNKTAKYKSADKILDFFIKNYEKFFDSRINAEIERHNQLGENKNEFYVFNKNIFISYFRDLSEKTDLNKKNVLTNLHLAYAKACYKNNDNRKIIVLQLQHIHRLQSLNDLDYEIIYTLRDPIVNISSIINNWTKYNDGKNFLPKDLNFHIDRVINGIKDASMFQKKIYVIKLEKLHHNNYDVMKNFCDKFDINYEKSMTESTYHGKKWWGDKIGGKYLNGINLSYEGKINFDIFYDKDISIIEKCIEDQLKFYNYSKRSNKKLNFFLKYAPFKFEIKVWMQAFKNLNIKAIISIFPSWIKRVAILKRNNNLNINLPASLGEKKQI